MKEKRQFKMILFDLDGTLIQYRVEWEKMRRELNTHFQLNYNINEYFKPVLEKIDRVLQIIKDELKYEASEIEKAREAALKIIGKADLEGAANSFAISGSQSVIHLLKEHGFRISAFTRNESKSTALALEKCGFEQGWFDWISTRNGDRHPVKPDPYQVHEILKRFNLSPDEVLVVGDHPYDIQAGVSAGSPSLGVLTGIADKETLLKAGALDVIDSVCDLPRWLGLNSAKDPL